MLLAFIIGVILFVAFLVFYYFFKNPARRRHQDYEKRNDTRSQKNYISSSEFEERKKEIHPNCDANTFYEFFAFLKGYPGGYYKSRNREIIYRDYTGSEKGALKGIFYNVVFSNPNLSVEDKEEFRMFIVSKGVNGCDTRPDYETRDSKLRNRKLDSDEFERKEVGNKGEEVVRHTLEKLKEYGYLVINGPVLEMDGTKIEYDHIVIGENGVFSIETKAFGSSKDGKNKASLFIDNGDKWILRKNGTNKELKSPTEQVLAERELLKKILFNAKEKIDVKSILVLSNNELFVKNNINLDYEVLLVKDLENMIVNSNVNRIVEGEKRLIAEIIDERRINA
ncbi:MAG: NERD domain-containing protein [Lachnospiraceae bacterium]|nr:NERD domain-containing protein [Lachnospiraceae bacterium]